MPLGEAPERSSASMLWIDFNVSYSKEVIESEVWELIKYLEYLLLLILIIDLLFYWFLQLQLKIHLFKVVFNESTIHVLWKFSCILVVQSEILDQGFAYNKTKPSIKSLENFF